MFKVVIVAAAVALVSSGLWAQTAGRGEPAQPAGRGEAAQPAGRGAPVKRAATPARAVSVRVSVRDQSGAPIEGARVILSGAAEGEFTTGAAGTTVIPNLKDGVYRVRCESEKYITLEREFTVKGAAWAPVDVVLSPAPEPPPPPPPAARPAPPPSSAPSGPAVTLSIPDFIERNFIGREPVKESMLACKPQEVVRLLQMRDGLSQHQHQHDEIVYIVAGEGAVRIGDEAIAVRPGSLAVVPHGSGHSFERRGKNPLILISTLAGLSCDAAKAAPER